MLPIDVAQTRLFHDVFLGQVQIVQVLLQRVEKDEQMIGVRYGAIVGFSADLLCPTKQKKGVWS